MFDNQVRQAAATTSSGSVNYSGPADPKERLGEVANEGRILENAINTLGDEIGFLESAISNILKAGPPATQAGATSGVPTQPRSMLADGLNEANRRVSFMIGRLQEIRSRVDL